MGGPDIAAARSEGGGMVRAGVRGLSSAEGTARALRGSEAPRGLRGGGEGARKRWGCEGAVRAVRGLSPPP